MEQLIVIGVIILGVATLVVALVLKAIELLGASLPSESAAALEKRVDNLRERIETKFDSVVEKLEYVASLTTWEGDDEIVALLKDDLFGNFRAAVMLATQMTESDRDDYLLDYFETLLSDLVDLGAVVIDIPVNVSPGAGDAPASTPPEHIAPNTPNNNVTT